MSNDHSNPVLNLIKAEHFRKVHRDRTSFNTNLLIADQLQETSCHNLESLMLLFLSLVFVMQQLWEFLVLSENCLACW